MDPEGNLAGSDSLFPSAKEERDIRRTGPDIKHHKPAACIFGSTETEIGPQGRTLRGKGDQRLIFRYRESRGLIHFPGKGNEQFPELFPACFRHLIRDGKTPQEGSQTIRTGLQRGHEHDLMQAEDDGTTFLLFPFEAGIQGT